MSKERLALVGAGGGFMLVRTVNYRSHQIALFPSVGEHGLYDAPSYDAFAASVERNTRYAAAIKQTVPGRVVLDIGTGRDALWAVEAARAGAAEVIAVEVLPDVAEAAEAAVRRAGVADRVTVVRGAATEVTLARRAAVCVSEIVGTIGGSEGVAAVLADARDRHCVPGAVFIPDRITTAVAAASLTDAMPTGPAFADLAVPHLARVFDAVGWPHDVRLCVAGPAEQAVISSVATVEDMRFGAGPVAVDGAVTVELVVTRPAVLDGFLLWVRLWCRPDESPLDALASGDRSWAPVFAPVSGGGVPVRAGHRLLVTFGWAPAEDGIHPDYSLRASVAGPASPPLRWRSDYRPVEFRASDLHRQLFPADGEGPAPAHVRSGESRWKLTELSPRRVSSDR